MASSPDAVTAWRIVKAAYAVNAFSGDGARITGGRWSSPGRRAVYTAESIALAALELLVHLQSSEVLGQYVVIPCRFRRVQVTAVDTVTLPADWRTTPAPPALRAIGDQWLDSGATAVLSVPSAVVEGERNYILNPMHRDFASISIDQARTFTFDARLLR